LQDFRASVAPPTGPSSNRQTSDAYGGGIWNGGQRRPEPAAQPGSWWGQSRSYPTTSQQYWAAPRQYGAWDAVMLWSLLNAVTSTRSNTFFRENQADPGFLQWRADANRLAATDPAIAGKLAQLDRQIGQGPSGASAAQHAANGPAITSDRDPGMVLVILVVGGALFAGLWLMRRRAASTSSPKPPSPVGGLSGSTQTRLRVGMTIPLDASPFILASGVTKVIPPAEGAMVSIQAVGLVSDGTSPSGGVALHRLYLPGQKSFFQLHLETSGQPDECRYFSLVDQVTPANRDEWAFWLDPAEGMIGWPEFQTKDGKVYGRAWASGGSRVPPRDQIETLRDVSGDGLRTLHAMMYAGATRAAPPAPATEYILVEAVEQGGQAWVDVYSGIDINPAALALPPVPLS
jgi:hypothetical protein